MSDGRGMEGGEGDVVGFVWVLRGECRSGKRG